jgi:hypothetical protein
MCRFLFTIVLALVVGSSSLKSESGEGQESYRPLTAEESGRLLNEFLPPAEFDADVRYTITLRIIPQSSPGFQLIVSHGTKARAKLIQLEKPWHETLDYAAVTGKAAEIAELQRLFPTKTRETEIDGEAADALLEGLWEAVREMSHLVVKEALKKRVGNEVVIWLDPSSYTIRYEDLDNTLKLAVHGPDPVELDVSAEEAQDPLVKWMLSVRKRFAGSQD